MNIALVHLCSFGDCLYATIVARQIKRDYPNCQLTWVIGDKYASILQGNPDVDVIHTIPVVSIVDATQSGLERAREWVREQLSSGRLDKAFFTQMNMTRVELYDGLIRSSTYRGYGQPVRGPHRPIVALSDVEIERVRQFVKSANLEKFRHVLLFECGPRSKQSPMTPVRAEAIAHRIALERSDTLFFVSSDLPLEKATPQVLDASSLSFRENAALANYCTGLVGCSSGITWLTTSTASKQLPMLQILGNSTEIFRFASVATDFMRFGQDAKSVIEMVEPDDDAIIACVRRWLSDSHASARHEFHQKLHITPAHTLKMFSTVRDVRGRAIAWATLRNFGRANGLRCIPWVELWPEFVIEAKRQVRSLLSRTHLLTVIRFCLGRNPDGTPRTKVSAATTDRLPRKADETVAERKESEI